MMASCQDEEEEQGICKKKGREKACATTSEKNKLYDVIYIDEYIY